MPKPVLINLREFGDGYLMGSLAKVKLEGADERFLGSDLAKTLQAFRSWSR
jgi:hypothetical protein